MLQYCTRRQLNRYVFVTEEVCEPECTVPRPPAAAQERRRAFAGTVTERRFGVVRRTGARRERGWSLMIATPDDLSGKGQVAQSTNAQLVGELVQLARQESPPPTSPGGLPTQLTKPGMPSIPVGALDGGSAYELCSEGRALAHFGETEVLVVRTRRGIFAVESRCPHMGRRLHDAALSRNKVICMGHGRHYDLASGRPAARTGSRAPRLRTFDVAVFDGRLWLAPRGTT